jgi:hypothetical protein
LTEELKWHSSISEAIALAKEEEKLIFIDFFSPT